MKLLCCSLILLLLLNMPEVQSVRRPTPRPTGQPSGQPTRQPTGQPTRMPTSQPSRQPTGQPTGQPSRRPTRQPSRQPTGQPTGQPSRRPTRQPTGQPTRQPTRQPTGQPSRQPTSQPSSKPSSLPTQPTGQPTGVPSGKPSRQPTRQPTGQPSTQPTSQPSSKPSSLPTQPTGRPTSAPSNPTGNPTSQPSRQPSSKPSSLPTQPTGRPTSAPSNPTGNPTSQPSAQPSRRPTGQPTGQPTRMPTSQPSRQPTGQPTGQPSRRPTRQPTGQPTRQPTRQPTGQPSTQPTSQPSSKPSSLPTQPTGQPTSAPSNPTGNPTSQPSAQPSRHPTRQPTGQPTRMPTSQPSRRPTGQPTGQPSRRPTRQPTGQPTRQPTRQPTGQPSRQPTSQPSSKPSSLPTQPTGHPTSAPSNPTGNPTSQPSRQPTGQPTGQPSRQPTRQPTGQPTRMPTSQPSRQPTGQPTSQPSTPTGQPTSAPSNPTGRPTRQPTGRPTGQPTREPTSKPSTHPSGQPTTSPSNKPIVNRIVIDIEFESDIDIKKGTTVSLYLPQIEQSNLITTEPSIVENYIAMPILWALTWYGMNQTLHLVALKDIPASVQKFSIESELLVLSDTVIYEDSNDITYSIYSPTDSVVPGGYIDTVSATGFETASMSFSNRRCNESTDIIVGFTSDQTFVYGDKIMIHIPNLINTNDYGRKTGLSIEAAGMSNVSAYMYVIWNNVDSTFVLNILNTFKSIDSLIITAENGFKIPVDGINNKTGYPTIQLRSNWELFGPALFEYFQPISCLTNATIAYKPTSPDLSVQAGQDVIVSLYFEYTAHGFYEYDIVDVFLPLTWSKSISQLTTTDPNFKATWIQCEETLRVQCTNTTELVSSFDMDIYGLRLPDQGVNASLAGYFRVSTNSSSGSFDTTPLTSVDLISHVIESSITFEEAILNGPTSMIVSVTLATQLEQEDVISIYLPAVSMISNDAAITSSHNVSFQWNSATDTLEVTVNAVISPADAVYIYCDVSLPSTGFPPVNSALARVPPTISLTGVNGMIDSVSFKSVETVGLRYGAVHYGLFNELSDEVSLRLQFFLSGTIAQDDVIKIFTPYVYKSSSTAIVASGDQAEDEFASPFNISTHLDPSVMPGDRYIQLQATDALIAAREINVFIAHGNDLFLDRTSVHENQTNFITAELSSFGVLINSTLDYFPKEMNRVAVVNGVNTSLCPVAFSVQDEFTRNDCSIDVDLNLSRDLVAGESIIISHEGLIHSLGSTQLSIASDASAYFDAYWRDADEVDDLSLSSTEIGRIEEGYVYTHSTYSYFDPNSTIPFEKTSLGATIISDIPRILAVYVPDSVTDLTCKDAVFIHLQFTERVMVTSSQAKMLLNTLEYARYYDGNGTDLLRFVYNVDAPVTTVDLSIFGPSALELGLTSISRAGRADVVANVTIPRPHNTLLRNKYSFEPIAVSCEQELLVSKVYSLRDGNKTYYSGDIIDVAVEFIRDVAVIGSPYLALSNSSDVRAMYNGTYSTVSTTQVITVQSSNVTSAYFQVSYNGISSKCVSSSDSTALYDELVSMANLELSLPVELSLTAIPNGYQHTLNFTGIAPGLLTVSETACGNQPAAVTSVSTGDSALNTLVFRYIVGEEDVADKLLVTALLQDPDNYVYIRGQTPSFSNLSIVLPTDENSFEDTTSIALKRIKPSVEYLTSPSAGLTMISGDYIDISVVFTAPIIVFGHPVLVLKFDSFLPQQDSGNYVKQVPMYDTAEDNIRFRYNVQVGDQATTLEVNSTLSLHLNGSEIKLNSLYPTVDADVTLPVNTTGSLSNLNITVEAITEPVVNSIYPDKVKGLYSAGELIYINIQFSSPVQLVASSFTPPHIVFGNNSAGQSFKMYYVSGTNTSVVTFLYTVEYGDDTDELVLNQDSTGYFIHVESGEFHDYVGNIWNKSYVSSADFASLSLIGISTAAAGVERVDVVQPDGTYYPGQALDIYVRFTKNVLIFPNPLNGNLPSLALFVPFQDEDQLLAVYAYGNGTAELHFEYVIPVPNTDYNIHPEVQLNYEGVAALASHMRGGLIRDSAVNAVTDANVALPAVDKSYLLYSRDVKLVFARPKVAAIHFLPSTPDGTYGVGDQLQLAITFTQPVMVFEPPVLKLFTAFGSATATNRSATYVSGNYSHVLYYMYEVQDGDRSSDEGVDYIDTRYSPYFLSNSQVSLALNSDVIRSNTGRVNTDGGFNREDDIVLTPTKKGGIFRATRTSSLVLANTELPLPGLGDPGSLSTNHRVVIDTRSPNITGVYTPLHNGSYGAGVVIPVLVSFNYPVLVRGCPRLLIRVSNIDKYAEYASGSATDKLLFEYTVEAGDYLDQFDYFHTSSLSVIPCTFEDEEISARTDESTYYIKRMSRIPTADVNYTLPFVTYVETVIAPVSLTGRGSYLTLVGSRARPQRVVTTSDTHGRTYGIGDVVMVGIEYSDRGIQVANGVYLLLQNVSHGSYFSHIDKKKSNLAWFSLVILQYDRSTTSLAYRDSFALYSNALCDIHDRFGDCAAYNLPVPGGTGDELSSQDIILTDSTGIISGITMIASEVGFALEETASILGVPLTTLSQDRTRGFGRCEGLGRSHYYHEIADEKSEKRKILTTSCPNHFCVDQTASFEENFSKATPRKNAVEIPLIPAFAQISTNISLLSTDIGIALNGVPFGGPVWSSAEHRQSIDKCGGFADDNGNYRYVVPPVCLLTQLNHGGVEHSPQIGWALDGFPIYGPRGVDGLDMVPCSGITNTSCLDECNGYYGELPAIDNFKYRYYVSSQVGDGNCSSYIENGVEYGVSGECLRGTDSCCVSQIPASTPFILGCLKGCLLSDATCVSTEVGIIDELAVNTVPRHPTRRYDGSLESTQDFIDEDIKIPRDSYYPDPVWDMVSNVTNRGQIPYETGSLIEFIVTFSEPVIVQGTPSLALYFSEGFGEINTQDDVLQPKNLFFSHMKSPDSAVFNAVVNAAFAASNGYILCSRYSKISLNGGRVLKEANFLPVRDVDLSLGPLCCAENCEYVAPVLTSTDVTPRVSKVYSNQAGSLANPDEIDIFVEFNTPVAVIGSPFLELDLAGTPRATYLLRPSMNTLQFRYTISAQDFSSSLDYLTTYSLGISTGLYDNVVKAGIYEYIPADLTLPERGSTPSLGRTSSIVIDNSRAQVLAVDASVDSVTAGDDIKITVSYNQVMAVPDSRYSRVDLLFVINDGNVTVPRQAYLLTRDPANVLEFLYTVTALDPTGVVFLADEYPLEYTTSEPLKEESYIRSAANNVKGPVKFLRQFLVKSLTSIDNQVPAVLGIASPDTGTQYPWGVGDVINIYVTLTLPVVIVTEPSLLLAFEDSTQTATYVATSSTNASVNYTSVLHFKYVISDGDVALSLEYASSYSLLGDIRRYSANPLLQANLELPVPYSPGSLSAQSSVKVDTSPPYVESLFPVKRAGVYGANEVIVVVARFNKPVLVLGNPYLVLQTGVNIRGFANYTEFNASVLYSSIDVAIAIDILSTDVLFTYVVKKEDNIVNIHQEGIDSLVLGPGDQILHLTTIPTTAADVELRDPTDYELVNGQLVKQWKFRYPRKIELILRSLYHTDVSTLKVELEHLGKKAVVFDNVLHDRGKAFELGRSYPRSRLGNNETWIDIDTGIGYTYLFSDTQLVNIALLGAPQQSSTLQPAKYATDGNTDPLVSHYSVTETDNEVDAWWQVLLPVDSKVATINVYPRKPQSFVFPIIRVLMKGYDDYPKGRFCLHIVGFDVNNPSSARTTNYLQFGSSADQVKAKISALEGIGEVDVTMSMLQLCGVDHPGGCGSDGMEGYGYLYHIEFLSVQVSSPTVTVENVTWIGGTVKNGGINETENIVESQFYYDVTTTRAGFWHEVSNIDEYGMGVTVNGTATTESSTTAGDNQWLTPFWVMIFDLTEPPPSDLEESLKLAVFKQFYTSATDVCETALPAAVNATYVRVQRYGYGSLSLAEVEVYEEKLNTFSSYRSTSPVAEAPVTRPYQSTMPFMHEFNQLSVDGRWTVHLTQSGQLAHGNNHFGYGGAYGTISDAVLVITDIVGITHSYYQDLSAEVTSLPKYGKLYKSRSYSTHSYGDWRELFDITENGELVVREGGSRYMGYCNGVDTSGMNGVRSGVDGYRHCTDNFGVPPEFADYTLGDHASENYLRGERVVIYKPNLRYLGPDGFTYKVFDGVNEQVHSVKNGIAGYLNEVTVHVRTCRVYDYKVSKSIATTLEPICDCEESEYSIFNDEEKCNEARTDICDDVSKHDHYYAMCVACTQGFDTSECITQTTRALGFMSAKGLCSTAPRIDCSDETVTAPGRDRINYMSLKAPISSYHTFTALGNSFGFSQM